MCVCVCRCTDYQPGSSPGSHLPWQAMASLSPTRRLWVGGGVGTADGSQSPPRRVPTNSSSSSSSPVPSLSRYYTHRAGALSEGHAQSCDQL